mmetsp:Transcript_4931/g.6539  ORF Transcript_4931/g.6539 Transcript_4931/m.6539 type:complete len:96 (-) Transcript_4931:251-538(-)
MAATAQEFRELMGVDDRVDIPLLRRLAYYGIPDEVRGAVWKLLLPTLSYTDVEDDVNSTVSTVYNLNKGITTGSYEDIHERQGLRTDNEVFIALR